MYSNTEGDRIHGGITSKQLRKDRHLMKKLFSILVVVALIATIGGLSVSLYNTKASLSAAEADIEGMTFTEGKVIEGSKGGGIVTVSLKNWVYFEDDSFVSNPTGSSLNTIFCELHKNGFVDSFNGNLAKLKYTKKITVRGSDEKTYYLV